MPSPFSRRADSSGRDLATHFQQRLNSGRFGSKVVVLWVAMFNHLLKPEVEIGPSPLLDRISGRLVYRALKKGGAD
jgi:hypothetical protein